MYALRQLMKTKSLQTKISVAIVILLLHDNITKQISLPDDADALQ